MYYTLVCLNSDTGQWSAAFGDPDEDVVEQEFQDRMSMAEEVPEIWDETFMKIIATGADQADIDHAVAKLNK